MIIKPKVRGFMCTTAHPAGCEASVKEQIAYVKAQGEFEGPKRVLVIGASTGYGLASRITAAFGSGAKTIGVFFEKPGTERKPGSAGYYNAAAFSKLATEAGLYNTSFNGDAFSKELKQSVIAQIKADLGQVDLVVYSLAAPMRQHPETGVLHRSTLKPIGKSVTATTLNTDKSEVKQVTLDAASQEEIDNTVAVMGGEDWQMWIDAMQAEGVLADGCQTTAYTYLGDKITHDIYWDGTIGAAKKDLDERVKQISASLESIGGSAHVSVLKALVTQASSAIPIMPLYLALLFKVMKADGVHEGCIEQIYGLFTDCIVNADAAVDGDNRYRMDGKELERSIQQQVEALWPQVTTENIDELTDFAGYKEDFLKLFGFGFDAVDYDAEVEPELAIAGLVD
ncbi:MAG: trans-2-enoyl-CoA reductase family protein [Pseudomonadales bacterium]|nr:trans-2-enoyl-CoA reductase family protein [Pseudomonadales bacterium]